MTDAEAARRDAFKYSCEPVRSARIILLSERLERFVEGKYDVDWRWPPPGYVVAEITQQDGRKYFYMTRIRKERPDRWT